MPEGASELSDSELTTINLLLVPDNQDFKQEEVEEKAEEVEEIEPDHYYGGGKIPVFAGGEYHANSWAADGLAPRFRLLRQTGQRSSTL